MSEGLDAVVSVSGEGPDLKSAVADAAARLGLDPSGVEHKLDLAHFRTPSGSSMARRTVKVIAWPRGGAAPEVSAAPAEAPRPVEAAPEAPRAPEPTSEVATAAQAWFAELLRLMGIEGTVTASGGADRVRLHVRAEGPGRLIGRRGTTLGAVRHLLALALKAFGEPVIDVDVDDERGDARGDGRRDAPRRFDDAPRRDDRRDDRRSEGRRPERSERSDRPPRDDRRRDDRPRDDRPRDDRPRDDRPRARDDRGPRDDRRDDRRSRRPERSDRPERTERSSPYTEVQLQEIARRAAAKALQTGKPITINVALNSYDRRVVHVEVSAIEGVSSQSILRDDVKYVQVVPGE